MSWILESMSPDISETFMLYDTVEEIWKATKEMYSKKDNIAELYELKAQLKEIKQGDQAVTKYYGSFHTSGTKLALLKSISGVDLMMNRYIKE